MADNAFPPRGGRSPSALSRVDPVWWDRALLFILAVYPLVAVVRAWTVSDDIIFILCAIAVAGSLQRGSASPEARQWISSFGTPAGVLAILLVLYTFLSLSWTILTPDYRPVHVAKVAGLFVLATLLAPRIAATPDDGLHKWLAITTAIALVILGIDGATGHKLTRIFYGVPIDRRVNPSAVSLSLLLWPALAALALSNRKILTAFLWLVAGAVLSVSSSQAAFGGYLVGTAALLTAWLLPRAAVWLATSAAVAGSLLAPAIPWLAGMTLKLLPPGFLHQSSALVRVEIWTKYSQLAMEAPVFGHGALSLGKSHPHNFPLQIWAELGFVGTVLAASLLVVAGIAISRLKEDYRPFALAFACAAYLNAYVSYGMWEIQFLSIIILPLLVVLHGARNAGTGGQLSARDRKAPA